MFDFVINHSQYENDVIRNIDHPLYIWFSWILANSLGELIGLGAVFLIGTGIAPGLEMYLNKIADIVLAGILVIVGTLVEGSVLGTLQWIVIQHLNKSVKWLAWVNATLIGIFIAWALGSIPSTMLEFGTEGIKTTFDFKNMFIDYLTIGGMGLVSGAVIGLPQWLLLRLYFHNAEWWVPASSIAWMMGMIILFVGINVTSRIGMVLKATSFLVLILILTGAIVGSIHGIALLRLYPKQEDKNNPDN